MTAEPEPIGTFPLPAELDDVDAAFMTTALAARYPGTSVSAVDTVDVQQGSASSLRLRLIYGANPSELPDTMFMKGDFIDHEFTSGAAFAGEALFFSHLVDQLPESINRPHAFFSGLDDEGQAIVVLEDMARRDVRFGDCEQPLEVDTVAEGVTQLAALNAAFWRGAGLERFDFVDDVAAVASLMRFLVQADHFDDYIQRDRASFLPAPLKDRETIEKALEGMFAADQHLPVALVHGDAHLGNTFRDADQRLGFCDFQAMGRGPYIWDVTYFLTGALEPADRRRSERDLLAHYLDHLASLGAQDVPSLDETFLAHRRHMMHGYLNILTPVEMQPDRFAVAMGERFAIAMEDLDTVGAFA